MDSNRIATKIKSASATCHPDRVTWKSNPSRACPNCQFMIDNSDVQSLTFLKLKYDFVKRIKFFLNVLLTAVSRAC